jgi:peroxiredoxin
MSHSGVVILALPFLMGLHPNLGAQTSAQPNPKAILAKATEDLVKSGQAERAIHQGQKAPHFTLPNAKGQPVRLSDLLKKGPVILTFYRGGWCPFCNLQLKSYQSHLAEIRAKGAELVAVSPQTPEYTLSTAEQDALTFPVLSDVGGKVAREYGLVFKVPDDVVPIYKKFGIDLEKHNGDARHELPIPGTYLIGRDGTVLLSHVDADYKKRLPVETILDALK